MAEPHELAALDESIFERVLCVAAHPDDLEYGTAAAVDKWVDAGKTVTYLLVTRGEAGIETMHPDESAAVREQEERDGAEEVGVTVVDFLDEFRDGVVEYGLPLRRAIAREIRRRRPDLIVTLTHAETGAGGWFNQADHRAVGLAALDARADAGNRWIFSGLLDEGLEPWQARYALICQDPAATHWMDVSGHFEQAVASLSAHDRYLEALGPDYPKPRDLLQQILGGPSEAFGVEHALVGRLIG
jgi:LmbE family N-acetylglucosaminyl deacetylase